jgi:hypothetical protein
MTPQAGPGAAPAATAMAVVPVAGATVPVVMAALEERKKNAQNETLLLEEKSGIQEN